MIFDLSYRLNNERCMQRFLYFSNENQICVCYVFKYLVSSKNSEALNTVKFVLL